MQIITHKFKETQLGSFALHSEHLFVWIILLILCSLSSLSDDYSRFLDLAKSFSVFIFIAFFHYLQIISLSAIKTRGLFMDGQLISKEWQNSLSIFSLKLIKSREEISSFLIEFESFSYFIIKKIPFSIS